MDAIVAVYSDWGIGANGTQPVLVRADRRHFRTLTDGAAVVVGRRTLADFPGGKPLKGRMNLLLTRRSIPVEGAQTVNSPSAAAELCQRCERAFVIGGAQVYREMFPYIDRVYVTKIECDVQSDVFFPNLDALPDWRVTDPGQPLCEGGIAYRFMTYERVKP